MPLPLYCPNRSCANHFNPSKHWYVRFGSYRTRAHGTVARFRCTECGKTCGEQTESVHYYAKTRAPFRAVQKSLVGGTPMREIANRYHLSAKAIANAVVRLGRQSMAAHMVMLHHLKPRTGVVFDGLRSFVTSQDYPCDLTTTVDPQGEVILTITHSIFTRGGTMTEKQEERLEEKLKVWRPEKHSMSNDISLLISEIWDYLRPEWEAKAMIDTDENPMYASRLKRDPIAAHFTEAQLLTHRQTSSVMPRTLENPLFPVNYIDRLLRHRLREHTRETIAFGRNAGMQMHRAWIFAYDHNCFRYYRVKNPQLGTHAEQGCVAGEVLRKLNKQFFTRRVRLTGIEVPESIAKVWTGRIPTPPHRWRKGQNGSDLHIPKFALRDLAG